MKSFLNLFILMMAYSSGKGSAHSCCQRVLSGGYRVGQQSPLDLNTVDAASCKENSRLQFNGFDIPYETPLILTNNGHTANLQLEPSSNRSVTGGPLNDEIFFPYSLHPHFGQENKCGSEHVIDGICFTMELHIVLICADCKSFQEATARRKVAVLAFMFQEEPSLQTDQEGLAQLSRVLSSVQEFNSSTAIENFTLSLLLNDDEYKNHFSYEGSLTTSPFAEGVLWTVFKEPIFASTQQMNEFRKLRTEFDEVIGNNYRALQPKNLRRVCHTSDNDDCQRNVYEIESNTNNSYNNVNCAEGTVIEPNSGNCNCNCNNKQKRKAGSNQNNNGNANKQNGSHCNCNNQNNNHNNGNGKNNNNNNCNCNNNQHSINCNN